MKHALLSCLLILMFISCTENAVEQAYENGNISIALQKGEFSDNIKSIRSELSRNGFESLIKIIPLTDSQMIEISFNDIISGIWSLKIEALDKDSLAIYHGIADIDVKPSEITSTTLQLIPVDENLGGIVVDVYWEPLLYNWFDHPQNPLLQKLNSNYDSYGVLQAYVFKDENDYKMYFTGAYQNSVTYVFFAKSTDGLSWERVGTTPVLKPGTSGSWDSQHVSSGPAIKVGSEYRLYYNGWADYRNQWHIGLAVSQDGITWEKFTNPVLTAGQSYDYRIGVHSVLKVGNEYFMYYGGQSISTNEWAEYIAVSDDGINWTKYREEPILQPENDWESTMASHCSVILDNGKFIMIYTGRNKYNVDAIGLAVSDDGFNWVKSPTNPLLTQSNISTYNYYEPAYPNLIKTDDEYRIYYTGMINASNTEICVFRKAIE